MIHNKINVEEIQITAIRNHYGNLELLKDGESYYMRMQDCESQEWCMIPQKLALHLIKYEKFINEQNEST